MSNNTPHVDRESRTTGAKDMSAIQRGILASMILNGQDGITVKELREMTGWKYRVAADTLLSMDRDGLLVLLDDTRSGCHVYVLPEDVDGRALAASDVGDYAGDLKAMKAERRQATRERIEWEALGYPLGGLLLAWFLFAFFANMVTLYPDMYEADCAPGETQIHSHDEWRMWGIVPTEQRFYVCGTYPPPDPCTELGSSNCEFYTRGD